MLEELVNNDKFLVKINFGKWHVLSHPIELSPMDEIKIKINCTHKLVVFDFTTEAKYCQNCNTIIK